MLINVFTVFFVSIGALFFLSGSVGLLRFPDVLSRLHALTKADNLGLGAICIGVLPQVSHFTQGLQILLIWLLMLFSGALSCYLIANFYHQKRNGEQND